MAVKSVDKLRRKKVMNENRILTSLPSNVNILKFYNYFETRNHLWMIFEFCPGGDLYSLLNADKVSLNLVQGQLNEQTARLFGIEILNGLGHLFSNEIIYCDLKPSTILLNEYSKLKLSDFGVAWKTSDFMNPSKDSQSPSKQGSPFYMAPELF